MTTRPSWTITEVAQRCGVSKSTVRRYREDGKFPDAFKDEAQQWRIPIEDLLAVGWRPNDPSKGSSLVSTPDEPVSGPTERERELESLLAIERAKREAAERIASMAQESVEDLRRAMRMLEQLPTRQAEPAQQVSPEQVVNTVPEPPRRRRWWNLS